MKKVFPFLLATLVLSGGGLARPAFAQQLPEPPPALAKIQAKVVFEQANVREALAQLAKDGGFTVEIAEDVQGTVTLSLTNVTTYIALLNVTRQVDATYRLEDGVVKVFRRMPDTSPSVPDEPVVYPGFNPASPSLDDLMGAAGELLGSYRVFDAKAADRLAPFSQFVRSIGYRFRAKDGILRIYRPEAGRENVMESQDGDIRDVVWSVFANRSLSFTMRPEVQGWVALTGEGTFEAALKSIVDQTNTTYFIHGGVYNFVPKSGTGAIKPGDLSIQYLNTDIRDAVRDLLGRTNEPYTVDPAVQGSVSIDLKNVDRDTALREVLWRVGADYAIDNGVYKVHSLTVAPAGGAASGQGPGVFQTNIEEFDVSMVDVREALRTLFKKVGTSYAIAPEVQGEVTLSVRNTPFLATLKHLLRQVNAGYRVEGGVVMIGPRLPEAPLELPSYQSIASAIPTLTFDKSHVFVVFEDRILKLKKDDLTEVDQNSRDRNASFGPDKGITQAEYDRILARKLDVEFTEKALPVVLEELARLANIPIRVEPDTKGVVTMKFRQVTLEQVLTDIDKQLGTRHGYFRNRLYIGPARRIRIVSPDPRFHSLVILPEEPTKSVSVADGDFLYICTTNKIEKVRKSDLKKVAEASLATRRF